MVVIGIDLGTTNSAVAIFDQGFPQVIQDETGSRLIPSLVTFTDEEILVGADAKRVAHCYPEDTIYDAKRFIGQKFHDKNVQTDVTKSLYKVVNTAGRPYVKVTHKNEDLIVSIEEVTAHLLRHIKKVAENHLNQPVTEVVITVPAHFDDARRSATKKAAEMADFEMVRIINEPTAAAIASQYTNKSVRPKKVLVYDFGGGTFDVSIVSVQGNNIEVIVTDGDCYLGGRDIDANLTEYIFRTHELNIKDSRSLRRFQNISEETKKALSFSKHHVIEILGIRDYRFTRQQFDNINERFFQKTIELIDRSLSAAKLTVDDLDEVVLVGGSSRIPRVRHLLKTKFPKSTINTSINPDKAIALGAAIYGGQINGDRVPLKVQEVLSRSLGIGLWGGITKLVIRRNTKLPCSKQTSSVTTLNNQSSMSYKVYQGESLVTSKNNLLGEFTITDIRKERRGVVEILTTMSINEEGILKVTAMEAGTDNSKELTISFAEGISSTPQTNEVDYETLEEELRYVEFIEKRNAFLLYCEDLKFDYQGKLERRPDVLKRIERIIQEGDSLKLEEEPVIEGLKREVELLVRKLNMC